MVPQILDHNSVVDKSEQIRLETVLREIEVLCHPPLRQHPNIIQLLALSWDFESPGCTPLLVLELAPFGSLTSLFQKKILSEAEKQSVCIDVACGLEAIHECIIAHGDIKQDNILIFPCSEKRFMAKISDFDHALFGENSLAYRGTQIYSPPEVHMQPNFRVHGDQKNQGFVVTRPQLCDVFAFGLLTFEIFRDGRRYYTLEASKEFQASLTTTIAGKFIALRVVRVS